jgi:hypothetical protein
MEGESITSDPHARDNAQIFHPVTSENIWTANLSAIALRV